MRARLEQALEALRWLSPKDRWLAAGCAVVILWSCLQIALFGFGRDQGIYAQVADQLLNGEMPYRDAWDFKPPGIFLIYALAQAALGKAMSSPRLLEVAGLLLSAVAFCRIARTCFGSWLAGLVGAALATLMHAKLEFWHTGQPESFAGFFTAAALWLSVESPPRGKRAVLRWVAIGALFGCAFLLKPPLGGGALVVSLYATRQRTASGLAPARALLPVLVMAAASLLPIGACAAWFWLKGAWPELAWTLFEFTPGYTQLSWTEGSVLPRFYYALNEAFFGFSALAALGVLAAIALPPMHSRQTEALLVVGGVIGMQLGGVVMQGKFFQYHYAATLPLIALMAGVGLFQIWKRLSATAWGPAIGAVAAVTLAGVRSGVNDLQSTFWQRSWERTQASLGLAVPSPKHALDAELYRVSDYNLAADRLVADYLRRHSAADERVFVWGFEPAIYWLSERQPASRFIYNVAQRAPWQRDHARRLLMTDLGASQPHWFIVQHNDVFNVVTGNDLDSRSALPGFGELAALLENYELETRIEDFDVYRRAALSRASR